MFESHFGLRENPFIAAHQTRYIYPSPEHQEALAHLRYGIENREPFVLITGEVGTGKTTALYDALSEWQDRAVVGLITNSSLTRSELLEEIGLRLGVEISGGASKPQIMVQLERHLLHIHAQGHRAILLLDEAQNLERDLLEEIRLLSNLEAEGHKLVQIFLIGQPELELKLTRPEMRQLRQRIAVHYRLKPLDTADTERYIHHRIAVAGGHGLSIFPPEPCCEVFRLTHGIPREINHLCAQTMVNAFVEEAAAVTVEHVRSAAEELEFQSVMERGDVREPQPAPSKPAPAEKRAEGPAASDRPPGSKPQDVQKPPPLELVPAKNRNLPPEEQVESSEIDDEEGSGDTDWLPPELHDDEEAPEPETGPPKWSPDDLAEESDASRSGDDSPDWSSHAASDSNVTQRPETPGVGAGAAAPAASSKDWQSWFDTLAESAPEGEAWSEDDAEDAASNVEAPAPAVKDAPSPVETSASEPVAPADTAMPRAAESSSDDAPAPTFAEALRKAEEKQASEPDPAPVGTVPPPRGSVEALPPRLRAKLEAHAAARDEKRSNLPVRLIIAAGILAVLLVGATLVQRFLLGGAEPSRGSSATNAREAGGGATPASDDGAPLNDAGDGPPGAGAANSATPDAGNAPARPAGTPRETRREPARQPASNPAQTQAQATPAPTPAPPPSTPAPQQAAPSPPPAPTLYALNVGTYMNASRADTERTKLSDSTAFTARVVPVQQDGVEMYRVLMGSFDSRANAERRASDLIGRGLVDEARVVTIDRQ